MGYRLRARQSWRQVSNLPKRSGKLETCRHVRRPALERLEDRTLFSVSGLLPVVPLLFNARGAAQVSHLLSGPLQVDLYRATLQAGDVLDASVSAAGAGSGLTSLLRVFDANGTPLALDDQQGGDPQLRFQAATAGDYLVGVSSAPDDNYTLAVPGSGTAGATTGAYTLDAQLTTAAPLLPDLTGNSFRLGADMAAAGDTVPVNFTVEDRGGADPGNFQVQVLLADSNLFDSSAQVLATLHAHRPAGGRDGPGLLLSGRLQRDAAGGPGVGADVRRSADRPGPRGPRGRPVRQERRPSRRDWGPLTVVTRVPAGVTDLSAVDPGLRTETAGTAGPNQVGTYTFTVSSALGNGELTAEVTSLAGGFGLVSTDAVRTRRARC